MKFENKKRDERRHWQTSMAPRMENVKLAHKWCKAQPSCARFYHHYTNTRWWFEDPKDAVMFSLMWL